MLCKSIDLSLKLELRGLSSTALATLLGFLSHVSIPSLFINSASTVSPKPTFFLELLAAPDGDVEAPDWSGGDGRGEDELLPFAAVFEGIEKVDLKADLGGPPTGTGAIVK